MPVETSKTEGELTKEAPVFTGASPAKVLSKFHHPAFFPELSPATTTEKYSSLLSDTNTGMGRGVSQARLISELQKGYGNRYTERVIAEYREKSKEDLEGKEEPTKAKETEKVTVPKESTPPTIESEVKETPALETPPTVTTKEAVPGAIAPTPEKPEPIAEKSLKTKPSAALREAPSEAITEGPEVEAKEEKPSVVTAPKAPPVEKAVKKIPPGKVAEGVPAAAAVGAPGVEGAEETRSPASPEEDPAFQAVKQKSKREARKQKRHEPAKTKAGAAQAAAKGPAKEVENTAKGQQVGKMEQQKAKAFDRKAFKAVLLKRIKEITPKNLKEADDFKSSGKAKAIKGEVVGKVQKSKENSQGDIKKTTAETPDQTGIKPKEVKAMPPTQVGPPPMGLRASRAAPKQKTESEVSLQKGSQSLEQQMVDGDVTEQQLKDSNEPEFTSAVDSKHHAQKDAVEAPVAYREEEQKILAGSKTEATESAGIHTHVMHAQRGKLLGSVVKKQETTKTTDETTRSKISDNIQKIYDKTKKAVEDRLKKLDGQVNKIFDEGAEKARAAFEDYVARRMRAYKKKRYSGLIGKGRWLKDKLFDLPKYVNTFYVTGRNSYIKAMDKVIDKVATAVETGLNDAKKTIAKGRKSVTDYVDSLPKDLKKIGKDAAEKIESDFDSLEQKVDDKQTQLVDSLARKYVDNLNKIDERIKKMKEANKGLVTKAKDAVKGVINTIRKLKNMLLNVLARVASVIGTIIKAPIRFLGNLVRGVGQGLKNFKNNIWTHLKKGLMGWLFGALEGAGIKLPAKFDIKGIISIVLQVLGLTYANFRARAVRILGEPMVKRMEQVAEIFRIVITKGAIGLWNWIKEKLTAIKETVWDGIMSFVKERIIIAGITWLIGLLNPAAAFIKACKMIYDIVMFFVNRGKQILALVNAVLNSIAAIASGSVAVAATAVENALSKALPVAISFLASLIGLGGISQKIRKIIERVQRPVNRAIDWAINKAVKMVQAVGGLFGKGKPEGAKPDPTKSPEEQASEQRKKEAVAEVRAAMKEGIRRRELRKLLGKLKKKYKLKSAILMDKDDVVITSSKPEEVLGEVVEQDIRVSKESEEGRRKKLAEGGQMIGKFRAVAPSMKTVRGALEPHTEGDFPYPDMPVSARRPSGAKADLYGGVEGIDRVAGSPGLRNVGEFGNVEMRLRGRTISDYESGHLIANEFGGNDNFENLVPQRGNYVNRGVYRDIEIWVRKQLPDMPKSVKGKQEVTLTMKVNPSYGSDQRITVSKAAEALNLRLENRYRAALGVRKKAEKRLAEAAPGSEKYEKAKRYLAYGEGLLSGAEERKAMGEEYVQAATSDAAVTIPTRIPKDIKVKVTFKGEVDDRGELTPEEKQKTAFTDKKKNLGKVSSNPVIVIEGTPQSKKKTADEKKAGSKPKTKKVKAEKEFVVRE